MRARLGFAFTERDEPAARARIERDLGHIVERVATSDPHVRAIVLTGSFSRGEGTVRGDAPVNDYDLVAIRSRPGGGRLARVAHALTDELGIEVDLLPAWRARLPHVGRKLFWLDLRLGGRVIAGDPGALAGLRRFEAGDLHPREVARLLGNRAAGLLLARQRSSEAPLQAAKAIIAAMDARLLHRGTYAARLRERLTLSAGERDIDIMTRAVEWKLRGCALPEDAWALARDALLSAVEDTGARAMSDGPVEHAFHLLKSRRFALQPSRRIRHEAWEALHEPGSFDARAFFTRRATTLQ